MLTHNIIFSFTVSLSGWNCECLFNLAVTVSINLENIFVALLSRSSMYWSFCFFRFMQFSFILFDYLERLKIKILLWGHKHSSWKSTITSEEDILLHSKTKVTELELTAGIGTFVNNPNRWQTPSEKYRWLTSRPCRLVSLVIVIVIAVRYWGWLSCGKLPLNTRGT